MEFFIRKIKIASSAAAITLAVSMGTLAQTTVKPIPPAPAIVPVYTPKINTKISTSAGAPIGTSERSIKTDPKINISLCIMQGNVKVNGWNRSEVRVFVSEGSKFAFKVQQKAPASGDPVWVMVVADDAGAAKYPGGGECLRGEEIEIDAPTGATLNLKGQEVTTTADGIRRVNVRNAGGDISVRNISDGVTAATYRGDLTVEQSTGAISLENTSGNIVVFDVGPSEIGDIFKAKTTSGAISVQKTGHRQLEVNSISGTVAYDGEILSGGAYSFITSNGSIKLTLPGSSSCQVSASYGFGSFSSDIPFKLVTENIQPGPVKSIVAEIGSKSDASLRLTTSNGSITIKKQ